MQVTLIGVDLAKSVLQVCGVNQSCKRVFNRQVKRHKLLSLLAHYPEAVIAMEACSGSNYWGRELEQRGYKVMLIPPQHVKPFVKGNKNDRNDALAICEAARRPDIHCVRPRSLEQTDMILAHRIRERRVSERTALINQLRGLLNEYGIVLASGKEKLRQALPCVLEDASNGLTPMARYYLQAQLMEWDAINRAIDALDQAIKQQVRTCEAAQRLIKIKGVGEKIASAAVAIVGDGSHYRNGRHFAANTGVVPKEYSSGGKQKLGRITKRGNRYLRQLLIQGAWSVVRYAERSDDRLSRWAKQVVARRGKHKAVVAVANKLARIIWAMLHYQTEYKAA